MMEQIWTGDNFEIIGVFAQCDRCGTLSDEIIDRLKTRTPVMMAEQLMDDLKAQGWYFRGANYNCLCKTCHDKVSRSIDDMEKYRFPLPSLRPKWSEPRWDGKRPKGWPHKC